MKRFYIFQDGFILATPLIQTVSPIIPAAQCGSTEMADTATIWFKVVYQDAFGYGGRNEKIVSYPLDVNTEKEYFDLQEALI